MASTPKNPLDGGGSIQGSPNMTIKPRIPAYDGGQFARDSMTPEPISVSYDEYWNEVTTDRPYHTDATPAGANPGSYTGVVHGSRNGVNYEGWQYSDDWCGGYEKYGQETKSPGPSKEEVNISANRADRGKES